MNRAVIFDLDGTLLDTLDDLAAAGNAGLKTFGYPPHPAPAYRAFVGDGLETLMRRALPAGTNLGDAALKELVDHVRRVYGKAWNVQSRPYEGVPALLQELGRRRGLRMAVLSNKPHPWTVDIVKYYFPETPFIDVRGAKPGTPLKPDPEAALDMAAGLGLRPEACFFVGDSNVDMLTGKNAGMYSIGAAWGFRGEEELRACGARSIARNPGEVAEIIT